MPGLKALRRIQLGQESVDGTPVVATAIWRGLGTIQDTREVVFPEEDVGFVSPIDRSYTPKLEGALAMDPIEATFEQLPYILTAGVKDITTGLADGPGTDLIYAYTFSTTAKNTIQIFTLEGGDDTQAEEFNYCFVTDFKLEGEAFAAWMMSANWVGREVTPTTFTGSISIPTVEEILFSKTKLYIVSGVVDAKRVRFWEAFGNLRWGIFCILQTKTYLDGHTKSVELATIGRRVAETEWELLQFMEER